MEELLVRWYLSKCRGDCGCLAKYLTSLSIEVIVVWLSVLSLLCEVIVVVPCLLCRDCFVREELCTYTLYFSNPQWRFPVWTYSENPSV